MVMFLEYDRIFRNICAFFELFIFLYALQAMASVFLKKSYFAYINGRIAAKFLNFIRV